jgi:hypothetical protein
MDVVSTIESSNGEPHPHPAVETPGYDGGAQFSPDGRWITYVSSESGRFEVHARFVSNDGSTLACVDPRWNAPAVESRWQTHFLSQWREDDGGRCECGVGFQNLGPRSDDFFKTFPPSGLRFFKTIPPFRGGVFQNLSPLA